MQEGKDESTAEAEMVRENAPSTTDQVEGFAQDIKTAETDSLNEGGPTGATQEMNEPLAVTAEVPAQQGEGQMSSLDVEEPEEKGPTDPFEGDIVVPPSTMGLPTRVEAVEALTNKHREMVAAFTKELEELSVDPEGLSDQKQGEMVKRDSMNEEVALMKTKRRDLKLRNKELTREMFDLYEREERLKERSREVRVSTDYVRRLEWKIETEDTTLEKEREHIDEIKKEMKKLRELTDGYTPDEIKVRISTIQEEIDRNLMDIEDLLRRMQEKAEESNVHHEKFVDAQKRIREKEGRRGWLNRRIELHTEMVKFWEGQRDIAARMDEEESIRPIGSIKEKLLKLFEERDSRKDEEQRKEGQGSGAQDQPPERRMGHERQRRLGRGGRSEPQREQPKDDQGAPPSGTSGPGPAPEEPKAQEGSGQGEVS